jgi:hypothetical protein
VSAAERALGNGTYARVSPTRVMSGKMITHGSCQSSLNTSSLPAVAQDEARVHESVHQDVHDIETAQVLDLVGSMR